MVEVVKITRESGIPLLGCIAFGIIDRGTNLLQVRCTSICNMNCGFCSTDSGVFSKNHKTNYIVDIDYLVREVEKIAKFKGSEIIIFLDSVGEPMSHPDFVDLVRKLKLIEEIKEVVVITNGTFLTKEKINALKEVGLDRINLSLQSLDLEFSKKLFGMNSYDVNKIKEMILYAKEKNLDLMLTPVFIPNINDKDIEEIIKFAKEVDCKIGLQKYETYRYSRKMKGAKKQTYWKFNKQLEKWEKEFGIKLRKSDKEIKEEIDIHKTNRLDIVLKKGEKLYVKVKAKGWLAGQMIGVGKDRAISINNCNKKINDKVRIEILENQNNLYVAKCI